MKAMIFAAGLGTRLKPITDSMPKALVPVGGVPMLARVIEKIRDAGVGEIVVNACHFSSMIVEYLRENGFGVKVEVSLEVGAPLETGGGIRHAEPFLKSPEGRFLVHNVDILSDLDLGWFIRQDDPESLATLLVVEKESDRYLLFDDEMHLVGWTNALTGEVKSPYPDLNPSACRRFSFCGVHIISEEVFKLMEKWPEHFGIIDFYLSVCAVHTVRGVPAGKMKIIDIGSPAALLKADEIFFRNA